MAITLSSAATLEKNKIANESPWILLLELTLPTTATATVVYLTSNNEDIPWPATGATLPTVPATGGHTYTAIPMDFSDKTEDSKTFPTLQVKVSNITGAIQSYLELYDGLVDCPVTVKLVHAAHLDLTTAEIEESFVIQETSYDSQWVTFKLGADFWVYNRALQDRYIKDWCRFKYGQIRCGVSAATQVTYPTCNKTLAACRERGNSARFGGFPGLVGGFYASNR